MPTTPLKIVPVTEIPVAEDAPTDDLLSVFRIITQMERVCVDNQGIGLSAVQVGIPWKLFIINRDGVFEYYLNCEYVGFGDKSKSIEGCLSLRTDDGNFRRFELERYPVVAIKGKQLKVSNTPSLVLEDVARAENGIIAVVMQHEIDHQNDILISDIGKEILLSC